MPRTMKPGRHTPSDPIRGYSRRGFLMGWCAITLVGVMSFGLLILPLGHSRADLASSEISVSALP